MLLQGLMEVGLRRRHDLALKVLLELLWNGLNVLRLARLVVEHLEDLLVHDALHASHGLLGCGAADMSSAVPCMLPIGSVWKVFSFTIPYMHHTLCWGAGLLSMLSAVPGVLLTFSVRHALSWTLPGKLFTQNTRQTGYHQHMTCDSPLGSAPGLLQLLSQVRSPQMWALSKSYT